MQNIPTQTVVNIIPFMNSGCTNYEGRVVGYCEDECCIVGSTTTSVCYFYKVKYMVENCGNCQEVIGEFCEFDLQPIINPPVPVVASKKVESI